MYGVENRFKMQLFLGLKGSPLVGVRIVNFVPPDIEPVRLEHPVRAQPFLAGVVRVVLSSLVRPGTDGIKIGLMTRVF